MVGARGFTADYALIVTWERMAYGGAPKSVSLQNYPKIKDWVQCMIVPFSGIPFHTAKHLSTGAGHGRDPYLRYP